MPHKDPEKRKKYFQEYYKINKEKLNKYRSEYSAMNLEKEDCWRKKYLSNSTEKRRSYTIKSRYGITDEVYDNMLSLQDGKCAICNTEFIKRPHIDHDHITGKIRGLLCSVCNTGLGIYENKKDIFEKYLRIHNATTRNFP